MTQALRFSLWLALAGTSLTACQLTGDAADNGPAQVRGEWRLAVQGGGITGVMSPVPAGQEYRLVLGPDSTYARYDNGKLVEASTFQVRTQPGSAGGPAEQLLILKMQVGGQPMYYPYYITLLTANKLHFTTGGGCALNSEYVRAESAGRTSSL